MNCGYTMSTTREGKNFFRKHFQSDISIITIQFGLVDSWKTFKYAPYVLYYPDSFLRKIARKLVKKYKKISKLLGLHRWLGTASVVSLDEYIANIKFIIEQAKNQCIILVDTPPHKEVYRNTEIQRYNNALDVLANSYSHCTRLHIYNTFKQNFEIFYADNTHMNDSGHEYIKNELITHYNMIKVLDS
ncbi:MAG: hypothetical protein KU29_10775 [Sulfurovum sp. FS06-10]|nr:MAG: hypothetical protein KU29_10775 [Sulfurovum sp. FS06-10]